MGGWSSMIQEMRDAAHPRLTLACAIAGIVPRRCRSSLGPAVLRRIGALRIGSGARFAGPPTVLAGARGHVAKVSIGEAVVFGVGVVLNPDDEITIGDRCRIDDAAMIYTTTHRMGPASKRCLPGAIARPVVIGDDVVIGRGAIVLPGCELGDRVRVVDGAVASGRVPPGSVVGVAGAV